MFKLFQSKVSAASEKDISKNTPEEREKSIPLSGEPIKVAAKLVYAGQFGIPQYSNTGSGASIPQWISCREGFQGQFVKGTESFAFSHKDKCGKNVAAFVARFEDKLRLKNNRTFFTLTDKNNIIIVKPSLWWRKYLIRRSLFTILLRAGQDYNVKKDNFEQALYSDKYAAETKLALKYFLQRKTLVQKKFITSGWRNTFLNKSEKQILAILQKPPPPKPIEETPATSENPNPDQPKDSMSIVT